MRTALRPPHLLRLHHPSADDLIHGRLHKRRGDRLAGVSVNRVHRFGRFIGHRQFWWVEAESGSLAVSYAIMTHELHTLITALLPPTCAVRLQPSPKLPLPIWGIQPVHEVLLSLNNGNCCVKRACGSRRRVCLGR
jgi:hypothetical protein